MASELEFWYVEVIAKKWKKKKNFQHEYNINSNFSIVSDVVPYIFCPIARETKKQGARRQVLILEKSPDQSELHEGLPQETQIIQPSASIRQLLRVVVRTLCLCSFLAAHMWQHGRVTPVMTPRNVLSPVHSCTAPELRKSQPGNAVKSEAVTTSRRTQLPVLSNLRVTGVQAAVTSYIRVSILFPSRPF